MLETGPVSQLLLLYLKATWFVSIPKVAVHPVFENSRFVKMQKAKLLMNDRQYNQAEAILEGLKENFRNDDETITLLADVYYSRGAMIRLRELEETSKLLFGKESFPTLYIHGNILACEQKRLDSCRVLLRASKLKDSDPRPLLSLGNQFFELRDPETSLFFLKKYLGMSP